MTINNARNLVSEQVSQLVSVHQHHLIQFVLESQSSNGFVINKLLSNLLLLFVHNYKDFPNPLQSLAELLGSAAPLSDAHIHLLSSFSAIIVEELCREQNLHSSIHDTVYENIFPVTMSLLTLSEQRRPNLDEQCISCLTSWITYIVVAEDNSSVRYTPDVTFPMVHFIVSFLLPDATLRNASNFDFTVIQKTMTAMSEIFDINPRMISADTRNSIRNVLFSQNQWGHNMIADIQSSDLAAEYIDECSVFANLIVTFVLTDIMSLSRKLLSQESQSIVALLVQLTNFPGVPAEDDLVSGQMLAFWEDLANVFIDDAEAFQALFDLETDPIPKDVFESKRNELFTSVCMIYWEKIRLPSAETIASSGLEFNAYRSNVSDFYVAVYSLLTLPFFEQLLMSVVNDLHQKEGGDLLVRLESTIFLLYKITDDMSFYENQCNALLPSIRSIYDAGIIHILTDLPRLYKSTFVRFFSSTQFFLKTNEGAPFLGKILEFLFLIIFGNDANLSLVASKTVLTLCQECRENMKQFLPVLEQILGEMLKSEQVDNLIRQRLFNAFMSVAQTIKDPTVIATTLSSVLGAIRQQFSIYVQQHQSMNADQVDYLTSLLASVNELGKACQLSEEVQDFYTEEQIVEVNAYWASDPLNIKPMVLQITREFSEQFPLNALIAEKCCLILRSGIGEPVNGPFQFSFELILEFMINAMDRQITNVVQYVLGLFEKYVTINHKLLTKEILQHVLDKILIVHLNFIKSDPDMVLSSIQLFAAILEKSPSLLVGLNLFAESVLPLALDAILAHETFVLRAISKFWIHLLTLRRANKEDQDLVKYLLTNADFGQRLVNNLLSSFTSSPRSNLEYYYPVFRNLIGKYPIEFKVWMENRGTDQSIISRLMITRGQRSANEVLRKFWMDANSLTDYHTHQY